MYFTEINWLILFAETVPFYSEYDTKVQTQNAVLQIFKANGTVYNDTH
jgi:hypothetical protein